jgi:hypothetical protein
MIQRCGTCGQTGHKKTTCPTACPIPGHRWCGHCKSWKPEQDFSTANKLKGTRLRFCSPCMRPYRRAWYARHKKEQIARTTVTRQSRVAANREWIRQLKSVPCKDCGGNFHWVAMDFDHLGDKEFDVGCMVGLGYGRKKILAEIAKCEVVCSNCHRLRTWTRMTPVERERLNALISEGVTRYKKSLA